MYKQQRNYENLNKAMFEGVPPYGIPQIQPVQCEVDNWIGFNYARTCDERDIHGVHFFIDDYQFNRVWAQPDSYVPLLSQFQAVCSPDFSTFTDFPKAIQIYNHYRKHWCAAYWQAKGITVIPTISWSDHESYDWCFDGEPVGSMVAISSVGTQLNKEIKQLFLDGYNEMLKRLEPSTIIIYGTVPEGCTGNIIPVKSFQSKWRQAEQLHTAATGDV